MRTVYERKAFVKFFERIMYFSDLYNQEGSTFRLRDESVFLGFLRVCLSWVISVSCRYFFIIIASRASICIIIIAVTIGFLGSIIIIVVLGLCLL